MTRRRRAVSIIGGLGVPLLLAPAAFATSADHHHKGHRGTDMHTRVVSSDDGTGTGSLRAAVDEANARGRTTTITLAATATYRLSLAGAGEDANATGDLDVTGRVIIHGNGATIDAGALDRAFDVRPGGSLTLVDVVLTGGSPPAGESGGAVRSAGSLEISGSRVTGNAVSGAAASGGGVVNAGGSLLVERSTLNNNSAERAGGAIEANEGRTLLTHARLVANATGPGPGNGGGLHLTGAGTVVVSHSIVVRNTAAAEGGGLWNSADGRMHVTRTILSANTAGGAAADQGGGGLFNDGGTLTVDRSRVLRNVAGGAAGSGGGILNDGGTLVVARTMLARNISQRAGGGIEADAGTTKLYRPPSRSTRPGRLPATGEACT